jgi:hypothetical protein
MTSALKAVLWILVAIVVIGGAYYWYESTHPSVAPVAVGSQTSTSTQASVPAGPTLASGSDTSDAALQQDLSGMDSQMSVMNSDTAAIDQGLNDTPVSQQ